MSDATSVQSVLDDRFAAIAVARGYVTSGEVKMGLRARAREESDYFRTLPSVLLELELMNCRQIDAVIHEMFDTSARRNTTSARGHTTRQAQRPSAAMVLR